MKYLATILLFCGLASAQFMVPGSTGGALGSCVANASLVDYSGGAAGGHPTGTTLGNSTHGFTSGAWNNSGGSTSFTYATVAGFPFNSSITLCSNSTTYTGASAGLGFNFATGTSNTWNFTPSSPPTTDNWSLLQAFYTTIPQNDTAANDYSMDTLNAAGGSDYIDVAVDASGSALQAFCEVALEGSPAITGPTGATITIQSNTQYWFATLYHNAASTSTLRRQCMVFNSSGLLLGWAGVAPSSSSNPLGVLYWGPSGGEAENATANIYIGASLLSYGGLWPPPGINATAAAPTYNNGTGSYINTVTVTVSDISPNSSTYYCEDLVNTCSPTALYSGPLTITTTGTYLRTNQCGTGWACSATTSALYTIVTWTGATLVTEITNMSSGGTGECFNAQHCASGTFTPTTGNLIAVAVPYDGATLSSVTDTCGTSGGASNTYTADASNSANYNKIAFFHTLVGFGKSCVVTANYSSGSAYSLIYLQDLTNVNQTTPVVGGQTAANYQSNPGTGANSITSTSVTSTQNNAYYFGFAANMGGTADTYAAGSCSLCVIAGSGNDGVSVYFAGEYSLQNSFGAQAVTFTPSLGTDIYVSGTIVVQHP